LFISTDSASTVPSALAELLVFETQCICTSQTGKLTMPDVEICISISGTVSELW